MESKNNMDLYNVMLKYFHYFVVCFFLYAMYRHIATDYTAIVSFSISLITLIKNIGKLYFLFNLTYLSLSLCNSFYFT